MSSKAIEISNAVVALITSSPVPATAELALTLNLEPEDLTALHVCVTPLSLETEWLNRAQRTKLYTVAVSVLQHVAKVEDEFPQLIAITEQIDDLLNDSDNRVLLGPQAHLTGTNSTVYDYGMAEESSVFLGVVTAQYKVVV